MVWSVTDWSGLPNFDLSLWKPEHVLLHVGANTAYVEKPGVDDSRMDGGSVKAPPDLGRIPFGYPATVSMLRLGGSA